jgi:hypothetical protein
VSATSVIERAGARLRPLLGPHWWAWMLVVAGAGAVHGGTALLRLGSFFPTPQALDFSSYYAGAWSLRLGLDEMTWSSALLRTLAAHGLSWTPPALNSPPLWALLLVPLTYLNYPSAAIVWTFVLVAICACSHVILMDLAGVRDLRARWLMLPVTLTFGPLVLNLTLGQNGPVLLLSALLLAGTAGGAITGRVSERAHRWVALAWVAAVAAKVFPVAWLVPWFLVGRWRATRFAVLLCLVAFGAAALLSPQNNAGYWSGLLPTAAASFTANVSVDDQSLVAYLSRLAGPGSYTTWGLNVQERGTILWAVPWDLPGWLVYATAGVTLVVLGGLMLRTLLPPSGGAVRHVDLQPSVLLVVLYTLMLVPHMERYNHILALPAMAWLWSRGLTGRRVTVAAYGLFALARLNHLWARLSFPVGPLAAGFGLFGVVLLFFAILGQCHEPAAA